MRQVTGIPNPLQIRDFWHFQEPRGQVTRSTSLALTCACAPGRRRPSRCRTDRSAPGNGGSTCGETDAMNDTAYHWSHTQPFLVTFFIFITFKTQHCIKGCSLWWHKLLVCHAASYNCKLQAASGDDFFFFFENIHILRSESKQFSQGRATWSNFFLSAQSSRLHYSTVFFFFPWSTDSLVNAFMWHCETEVRGH